MNPRLFLCSLVSALAGFLFVVISDAEKTIQTLWNLSPHNARAGWNADDFTDSTSAYFLASVRVTNW